MPRISKKVLLEEVVQAITGAGWQVELLSRPAEHPMRLTMRRGREAITARVYAWSLTHGGGTARPGHEYRIQITSGISRFIIESGEKTIVLGWSAEFGVYAGFDVTRHTGTLGSSPSMQVAKAALLRAGEVGVAAHARRREEVAVTVRPDLLAGYIERLETMHHKASVEQQVAELQKSREPRQDVDVHAEAQAERTLSSLHDGRLPRFGDPNERRQRRTVIDRLEALEQRMSTLLQEPSQVGHNNPPEPIDPETPVLGPRAIAEVSKELAAEVAKEVPSITATAQKTGVLSRIARGLRLAQGEAAALGSKIKTKAQDKIAEAAVILLFGGLTYFNQIIAAIASALESIITWLKMLM